MNYKCEHFGVDIHWWINAECDGVFMEICADADYSAECTSLDIVNIESMLIELAQEYLLEREFGE